MYRSATSPQLVLVPRMTQICQECGCACGSCLSNSLDLHQEIEDLRSKLMKSSSSLMSMEREFAESTSYAESELNKLQDELAKLRDRYDRLFESHKKTQRLNHNLEDKILTNVQHFDDIKAGLEAEGQKAKHELLDAKITISQLEEDCERYRNDCNTAVQLLQCKPSSFVSHKLDVLPNDLQQRLRGHLSKEQQLSLEGPPPDTTRMIKVPMATFPPTAMVYSVNTPVPPPPMDTVPVSLIAKILAQPEAKHRPQRLVICTKCKTGYGSRGVGLQTNLDNNGYRAVANMQTSPPTITPKYPPGVHKPRISSNDNDYSFS